MTRSNRLGSVLAIVVVVSVTATLHADVLMPVVAASIHDEPRDGLGDSFNNSPFEGLLREQSTREDRAVLEYDVTPFAGQTLSLATISGTVHVNNSQDNGVRTFNFLIYSGNGQADLSDFQIPAVVVGTGSYHPPNDTSFSFSFNVTTQVQALLNANATHVGLKVDCTSNPNFPNILNDETTLTLEVGAGCNPCDADCSGAIDANDIMPFVDTLLGAGSGCSACQADANGDGSANGADVAAFVGCLVGP